MKILVFKYRNTAYALFAKISQTSDFKGMEQSLIGIRESFLCLFILILHYLTLEQSYFFKNGDLQRLNNMEKKVYKCKAKKKVNTL